MVDIKLYDTTLRDGTQYEGISLSVEDKLKITLKLDELGIHYLEGGWPGANPKDVEYFAKARSLKLRHATLAAFGSTRRARITAEQDVNLKALVDAGTSVITLVGKTWDLHVTRILETSLEENLAMISDSVAFLNGLSKRVFFDAEHFFDGFKANPDYAIQCVLAAADAGAECVILCDTNGGTLPNEVSSIVDRVRSETLVELGIHAHNDADVAVANSLAAIQAGVTQVQGTANGYGERCGNANLFSIIANLKLKLGINCVTDQQLVKLTEAHLFISEIANMPPNAFQPYVGASAFTHKAGLHVSAVAKVEESYQHISPQQIGNVNHILISELSGRANITHKLKELGLDMDVSAESARTLLTEVKERESRGFQYEGAEASFELLVRRAIDGYRCPFELVDFKVMVEQHRRSPLLLELEDVQSEATVKVRVNDEVMHTAAEGNGPVNALDNALRKALLRFYPSLEVIRLIDYKVRVVDQGSGTEAMVRVLIESTDGEHQWHTVGCSANIIDASWMALADSLEYWLLKWG